MKAFFSSKLQMNRAGFLVDRTNVVVTVTPLNAESGRDVLMDPATARAFAAELVEAAAEIEDNEAAIKAQVEQLRRERYVDSSPSGAGTSG